MNDEAWKYVRTWYGKEIDELGNSEAAVHQQFTNGFEDCKKEFPNKGSKYRFDILGSLENGVDGERQEVGIVIPEYVAWFRSHAIY